MKPWLLLLLSLAGAAAAQEGMEMRHLVRAGAVALGVNPLAPASRTAFYEARGFTVSAIRPYAQACGFSFGMRNGGKQAVGVRLVDWRAIGADGKAVAFVLPETWDTRWAAAGVTQAARIAFKWAQFQSEISFEPGDWIMGMATLERAPAPPFRLVARYRDTKGDHELVLDQLDCVRD